MFNSMYIFREVEPELMVHMRDELYESVKTNPLGIALFPHHDWDFRFPDDNKRFGL